MTDDGYRQVFIKNIPYSITEQELSEWCSSFGEVMRCDLKRDKTGQSRGFGFVTFATIEGHNNILSKAPHYCQNRPLLVKTAYDKIDTNGCQFNPATDALFQTMPSLSPNDNCNLTPMDESFTYDNIDQNRLVALRDELEANLECMQIAHEHEIKTLKDRLEREKRLLKEAQDAYKDAEQEWRSANDENARLRTSLIKNVVQTFNIRRNLARQTKDQLKQCTKIEKQCQDIQSNQKTSNLNEKL